MLKRTISGAVLTLIVIGVLFSMDTVILPLFIALVCGIAVYELNKVANVNKSVAVISIVVGAYLPFEIRYNLLQNHHIPMFAFYAVYVLAMLIMMVKQHKTLNIEQVAISVMASIAVPQSLGCWIRIYDLKDFWYKYDKTMVFYLIAFVIICAWFSDIFAYLCGMAFGKHKMTPIVSPKKTWEGAIGGIIVTAGINVGIYFLFTEKIFTGEGFFLWDWYAVIPISIVLSVISIFGDLSASVIKRHFGIKDYGWIMPGHGGIMDRFDSMLFVFPTMYALLSIVNTFAF